MNRTRPAGSGSFFERLQYGLYLLAAQIALLFLACLQQCLVLLGAEKHEVVEVVRIPFTPYASITFSVRDG